MFKENKLGPGRPTHHQQQYQQQIQQVTQLNHTGQQQPQMNNGSQPRPPSSQYMNEEYPPNGIPQNHQYNFQPSYMNSQMIQPQLQQPIQPAGYQQHQSSAPYFAPQHQATVRYSAPNGMMRRTTDNGHEQEEDDRPWCFCGERSYGDMIACDNREV